MGGGQGKEGKGQDTEEGWGKGGREGKGREGEDDKEKGGRLNCVWS